MNRRDHAHGGHHPAIYKSLGLNVLVNLMQASAKPEVLDLGPALGANVDFWSRNPCRLHIRDLHRAFAAPDAGEMEKGLDESFGGLLTFEAGARFDMILAWDLFNYLEQEAISALMGRLSVWCKTGTLAFALVYSQPQIPAEPTLFRIIDSERISYETRTAQMRSCPRHQPRDLARLLAGFDISHSFLLRNGIQEFIFTRR
jgi:hypothetical protein